MNKFLWTATAAATLLAACGKSDEKPQEITKVRPIGVQNTPILGTPGMTSSAIVYVAAPVGVDVKAESSAPEGIKFPIIGLPSVTVDTAATTMDTYANLSIHKFKINYTVPSLDILQLVPGAFRRLRYSVTAIGNGQNVPIVNDFYVYTLGSAEATGPKDQPELAITVPADTAAKDSEVDITGVLTKNNFDETFKYGWYTGAGTFKNNRARETKWKTPPTPGKYTLILTARGAKVKSFAYVVKDITIQ